VGVFIARGSFASSSNETLTIDLLFRFQNEDQIIEVPAYADLLDPSKGKYKKRLVRGVWLNQEWNEKGPSANQGEEQIKDGWNGVFYPINDTGREL
jgi:hypothetical protein